MRLLLVEDAVGLAVGKVLEKWGYEVALAGTAEEARQISLDQEIDFFLVDWNLPGMSGLDLVQHVRSLARYATAPVVMISGRSSEEDVTQAMASGIDDYMAKPFTAVQLRDKIEEVRRRLDGSSDLEQQIAAIVSGARPIRRDRSNPIVLVVCQAADADSLRLASPDVVHTLGELTGAVQQVNAARPDIDLGLSMVPSTVDAIGLLRSWSVFRRLRLLVLSTGAHGNPVLLARLLSQRRESHIPIVVVCDRRDEIPLEHLAHFEALDLTVLERSRIAPGQWSELLQMTVGGRSSQMSPPA